MISGEAARAVAASSPVSVSDTSSRLSLVRTRLAYESTMLSWVRTATSLITFGFGVHQVFRIAPGGSSRASAVHAPYLFGTMMVGIGLLALIFSALEHRAAEKALNTAYPVSAGYPPAPRSYARPLSALIGLLGFGALILMHFGP